MTAINANRAIRGPVTAVPLVAGKGVRLTADIENNRWVAEADETVLFESSTATSTFTTSEAIENFEYLKIIVEVANGVKAIANVVMTSGYTSYLSFSYTSPHTYGNGQDYYMWRINYSRSGNTYTWYGGAFLGYTGSTTSSGAAGTNRGLVYKVIGVNRIASN